MKTVLITGSNGFTGKYVFDLLVKSGYRVIGLTNNPTSSEEIKGNLLDRKSLFDAISSVSPDYVIHLAALSFVGHENEREFYDVNLFGTQNLLEAIYESDLGISKIILASSANVYGQPKNSEHISEKICPNPVNHYATSKVSMEYMARNWFDRLPIIITRPFNYTGPMQRDDFIIPKIVKSYREKAEVLELGNIDVYRDFTDVRDISNFYLKLLTSEAQDTIINLCSSKVYSINDVINIVEHISGHKSKLVVNPKFVRRNEIKKLSGDNALLLSYIGHYKFIDFEKTLKDMYYSVR